jgi:hypothetical protein
VTQEFYVVQLSSEERGQLQGLVKTGNRKRRQRPSAPRFTRARILLKADQAEGAPTYAEAEITLALNVSHKTFTTRKH